MGIKSVYLVINVFGKPTSVTGNSRGVTSYPTALERGVMFLLLYVTVEQECLEVKCSRDCKL